jgi:hypothetical protein
LLILSSHQEVYLSPLPDSVSNPKPPPFPLTFLFEIQVFSTVMAPKSKKVEAEENPFLPPLVDLDRIPLADKDHLIIETRCEFDFTEL